MLFCLALIGTSCKKTATHTSGLQGTWAGTFKRNVNNTTAHVTLTFSGEGYSGTSDTTEYPEIVGGNFIATSDSLTFSPTSAFPANFDWTLILAGKYSYTMSGDSLFITRYYEGEVVLVSDMYKLKKQ